MQLVNTNQITQILGVRRSTVYRWMKKGFIKSYRPSQKSKMIYFDLSEIEQLIKR